MVCLQHAQSHLDGPLDEIAFLSDLIFGLLAAIAVWLQLKQSPGWTE
jgi:hypothetical protein